MKYSHNSDITIDYKNRILTFLIREPMQFSLGLMINEFSDHTNNNPKFMTIHIEYQSVSDSSIVGGIRYPFYEFKTHRMDLSYGKSDVAMHMLQFSFTDAMPIIIEEEESDQN